MMWGGYTWGWPGFVLAAIFMVACVALMGRMMGHGRMSNRMNHVHGSAQQSPAPYGTEVLTRSLSGDLSAVRLTSTSTTGSAMCSRISAAQPAEMKESAISIDSGRAGVWAVGRLAHSPV